MKNSDKMLNVPMNAFCATKLSKHFGDEWIYNPVLAENFLILHLQKTRMQSFKDSQQLAQCFLMTALSYYF